MNDKLAQIGNQLANAAYNLSQRDRLDSRDRQVLRRLADEWDAASNPSHEPKWAPAPDPEPIIEFAMNNQTYRVDGNGGVFYFVSEGDWRRCYIESVKSHARALLAKLAKERGDLLARVMALPSPSDTEIAEDPLGAACSILAPLAALLGAVEAHFIACDPPAPPTSRGGQ